MTGSSQSQESNNTTNWTTSPFGALFMNLFEGSDFSVDPFTGQIKTTSLANVDPIFGPSSFSAIGDLLTPNRPWTTDLGAIGDASSGFMNTISEFARTGGVDRLMAMENDILFGQTIPQLREEFGHKYGLGIGDSDFNAALARAVEGSANRASAQAIENMGLFSQAGLAELPGLLGLEQGISDTAVARTEGGTAINLFNTLASLGTQQAFLGGAEGSSSGSMVSAGLV